MKQRSLPIWLGAAGVLLTLALAACAPNGAATTGNGQTSATGTPGATATSTQPGGSPVTLPSDIPAYPGAHLLKGEDEGNQTLYFYSSADSSVKVLQFYQQQMPKNGWRAVGAPGPTANALMVYTKGSRRAVIQIKASGPPVSGTSPGPTAFTIIVSG